MDFGSCWFGIVYLYEGLGVKEKAIKSFYLLNNTLGFEFLEKVYLNPFYEVSCSKLGLKAKN